jgi:hypothetical protein
MNPNSSTQVGRRRPAGDAALPVPFGRVAFAANAALMLTAFLLLGFGRPAMGFAQAPADRSAIRLDITWIAASLSYVRHGSDAWFFGGGGGFGAGMMRALATPVSFPGPDFRRGEVIHMEGFASWMPSPTFHMDLGVRTAYVVYGRDDAVDAAGFVGPYVAPVIGFRRVKVGSRLQAGYLYTRHGRGMAMYVQPVVLRVVFPR